MILFSFTFSVNVSADLAQDAGKATRGGANSLENLKERARKDGALKSEHDAETEELNESEDDFPEEMERKKMEELELSLKRPPYSAKGEEGSVQTLYSGTKRDKKNSRIRINTPYKKI